MGISRQILIFCFLAAGSIAVLTWIPSMHSVTEEDLPESEVARPVAVVAESEIQVAKELPPFKTEKSKLKEGTSVYSHLVKTGVPANEVLKIIDAAKPIKNLASIVAKTMISLVWIDESDTYPRRVKFALSPTEALVVEQGNEAWQANLETATLTTRLEKFTGSVRSSLWLSAQKAGMDPYLINKIAEIFAWQVDFSRAVQPGDRWRLVAERLYANDKAVGWGEVVAAEYENMGVGILAVHFEKEGVNGQYFAPDGNSLKRLFLKSPLRFGRVTSRFNRARFHPILKKTRPHLGVDYGAPRGTPVMAVGNGKVEYAKRRGASGNTVMVRHNGVYKTAYKHLSRFAKGVKSGRNVDMGDVIGYVGSTGLATGPHLHFEMYEHGKYVDPLGIKFPSADPIPNEFLEEYKTHAQKSLAMLPDWTDVEVTESAIEVAKAIPELPDFSPDAATTSEPVPPSETPLKVLENKKEQPVTAPENQLIPVEP